MTAWRPLTGSARAVALEVLLHGPLSRVELARRLDLSQGSLSRLARPLLDAGLLVEAGASREPGGGLRDGVRGGAGRPQRPLDVVARAHHVVGVSLTAHEARGVLTDLRADVLADVSRPLPGHEPGRVVDVLAEVVEALTAAAPAPLTAVGVALGGHTADHRTVRTAPFLGWQDVPLAELVRGAVGVEVVVENDLVAFTEAESWFGAGTGLDRFAVVTVGAGIGFGLVVRGEQVVGADSGLGLVGHVPLDPTGPVCRSGHRGCASALLTTDAVADAVSAAVGRRVDHAEALRLAADGEPGARRVVDRAGRALGRLVALAANFTMPRAVVLGGEGVGLVDVARTAVDEALGADRDPAASALPLEVRGGDFGEWARGAAVVAIQRAVVGTG
ncbi:ROK family transcriptional regulator [Cellulomonas carbonis]|uniref:MarR family transcriptional regulator n=1 Tax=Cellulomonas carbonis T26 TaxID=947969 RepID=A0A0A0BTK8_9CELL|nr:ROK family transcriptional regulator [Cellulomonas carbonis]KGM11270.1 MarR family transcriptional regulator [Cellulomonas carbonis T26]GGC18090.1 MarR family transcriptional regulator [Cellulomonas carbonis]